MHHIYTTPAFVVYSSPHGESGKFLQLFTKDFGMIGAVAQGIRLNQSKLRYHLQDSDFSNVSVVRGKEVWRVTGAQELDKRKNRSVYLKTLRLLKRLLHGEEKNEELFEIIEELYRAEIKEEDNDNVECLVVLRILNNLGYISNNSEFEELLVSKVIDDQVLGLVKRHKSLLIKTINQALNESQL